MTFTYAISNSDNLMSLRDALLKLGMHLGRGIKINAIPGAIGYQLPGVQPATMGKILEHVRPERLPSAFPFELEDAAALAVAVRQKIIAAASQRQTKPKNAMDLLTMSPQNDRAIFTYLKQNGIRYRRVAGLAGIWVTIADGMVGGLDPGYLRRAVAAAGSNVEPGTASDEIAGRYERGEGDPHDGDVAVAKALAKVYEDSVDVAKEHFPAPLVPVRGMGTKSIDPKAAQTIARRSAIGQLFGIGLNK